MDEKRNRLKNSFYKLLKTRNVKCLEPDEECTKDVINAHSIQDRRILEQLAEDSHVIMLKQHLDFETRPTVEFERVGIHKATTFTGSCSYHDAQIFRPIDIGPIDISSEEHLFLLAYRSVLREMTVLIQETMKNHLRYLEMRNLELVNGDEISPHLLLSTAFMVRAYEFYQYKREFDLAYKRKTFDGINHGIIVVDCVLPTFAVSSVFTLIELACRQGDSERVILNIFPQDDRLFVVFSCLAKDHEYVKPHYLEVHNASGYHQKYLLSKLVLRNCENFVLSPRYFSTFSEQKKEIIKEYYCATIFSDLVTLEDPNLFLF